MHCLSCVELLLAKTDTFNVRPSFGEWSLAEDLEDGYALFPTKEIVRHVDFLDAWSGIPAATKTRPLPMGMRQTLLRIPVTFSFAHRNVEFRGEILTRHAGRNHSRAMTVVMDVSDSLAHPLGSCAHARTSIRFMCSRTHVH